MDGPYNGVASRGKWRARRDAAVPPEGAEVDSTDRQAGPANPGTAGRLDRGAEPEGGGPATAAHGGGFRLVVDLSDGSSPEPEREPPHGLDDAGKAFEGEPSGAGGNVSHRGRRRPVARRGPAGPRSGRGSGGRGSGASPPVIDGARSEVDGPRRNRVLIRLLTGLALGAVVLTCVELGPFASLLFVLAVVLTASAEWFSALRRAGYHPATLVGLLGSAGVAVAAYFRGVQALPLVVVVTSVVAFCWYLFGAVRTRSTANAATTLLGFVWIGVFGSYAALLLDPRRFPHRHGVAFFLAAVVVTIGYDVGAYAVGARYGKRPLLPAVSPKKTAEGLLGGTLGALVVSVVIVANIAPWRIGTALLLALVIAIAAPLGDLVESLMKRDIGIKDMGSMLPGHGGVLDRVDGILFALPATYYLVVLLGVH